MDGFMDHWMGSKMDKNRMARVLDGQIEGQINVNRWMDKWINTGIDG